MGRQFSVRPRQVDFEKVWISRMENFWGEIIPSGATAGIFAKRIWKKA
jgi:hypothetical protein